MRTCSGFVASPASGTWCARHVPSISGHPRPRPVTLSGCAARSSASADARLCAGLARTALNRVYAIGNPSRVPASAGAWIGLVASTRTAPNHSGQQTLQLATRDAGEDRRVGDLEAVQVQDGQHRAIARRIQELV